MNGAVETVNGESQQVFELLGRREEDERVPSAVRKRLRRAATVEPQAADEVHAIEPSVEAAGAINKALAELQRQGLA